MEELELDQEFRSIALKIFQQSKSEKEWAEIESSDMFQTDHYSGGYDADERAFCFSYFAPDKNEYWFQIPLDQIILSTYNCVKVKLVKANI